MNDYYTAGGAFLVFGPPVILWIIGIILFPITLTIFLKRLVLKQKDTDWFGRKGLLVAFAICVVAYFLGSWVLNQLH